MKRAIFCMVGWAMLTTTGPVMADDVIAQMRQMLTKGQAVEAYRLGRANETHIGEAEYDFLFGLAALDGGRVSEGVLALERYRMSHPNDDSAWLALARGYVLLGEYSRARSELEDFLATKPNEALAKMAQEYIDVVRTREEERLFSFRGWLEAGLGYDSNLVGGPDSNVVNLPIFNQVVLPDNLTKTDAGMETLAGGFSHHQMLKPGLTAFVDADAGFLGYFKDHDYNQANLGAKGGLVLNRSGMLWRTAVSHQSTWLDGSRYCSVNGLGEEWVNPFAANRAVSAFLQYALLNYGEEGGSYRDAHFVGAGLGWRQSFAVAWKPLLTVSLTVGDESNDEERKDLSRKLLGGGVHLNLTTTPQWGVDLGYAYQFSHYGDEDPILLMTRKDDNHSLSAGATYLVNRKWSVRGELSYNDNLSNIELNDYDRTEAIIKLRYDFR